MPGFLYCKKSNTCFYVLTKRLFDINLALEKVKTQLIIFLMATIVLADDHPLLLEGTKHFLELKGHEILSTSLNGNDAFNCIVKHEPDLAIIDFEMPIMNGIEVAAAVAYKELETRIVILSLHKQEALLQQVGKTIQGYITKDTAMEEMEKCIETLMQGQTYISPKISEYSLLNKYNDHSEDKLSPAEIKILKQLALNQNSTEIAETLFISKRTVEKHRSNIIKKLNLDSRPNSLFVWLKNHPQILEL